MVFQKPIALDPGVGGCSIAIAALQPADIIVSTTTAFNSGAIRIGTRSLVSHAALYAGNGQVIEAIGSGVVQRPIEIALADDALAVAYRSPDLPATMANSIVVYAASKRGTPYSVAGALASSNKIGCRVLGPRPSSFFCSQLVIAAYASAGRPLTNAPPQCVTPEDVVTIAEHQLKYIGHLKGNAAWLPMLSP